MKGFKKKNKKLLWLKLFIILFIGMSIVLVIVNKTGDSWAGIIPSQSWEVIYYKLPGIFLYAFFGALVFMLILKPHKK